MNSSLTRKKPTSASRSGGSHAVLTSALSTLVGIAIGMQLFSSNRGNMPCAPDLQLSPTSSNNIATTTTTSTETTTTTSSTEFPFALYMQQALRTQPRRVCPCCGWTGDSMARVIAAVQRPDKQCPVCGSRERHRKACAFLGLYHDELFAVQGPTGTTATSAETTTTSTNDNGETTSFRLLHFGPVPHMEVALNQAPHVDQVGLDYFAPGYKYSGKTMHADITALQLPTNFGHGTILLHVLEHVPDLEAAFSELRRVLQQSGAWILVEVPFFSKTADQTTDCRGETTPKGRWACAGAPDHVWAFDLADFQTRILPQQAGLDCRTVEDDLRQSLPAVVYESLRLDVSFALESPTPQFFCHFRKEETSP